MKNSRRAGSSNERVLHAVGPSLLEARSRYRSFLHSCRAARTEFRLSPGSDVTPYALCFAIFGHNLVEDRELLATEREEWSSAMLAGLLASHAKRSKSRGASTERGSSSDLLLDKPFMQLLAFSLSAWAALDPSGGVFRGGAVAEELYRIVAPLLPRDADAVADALRAGGSLDGSGAAGGNRAMFLAILLLHAGQFWNLDVHDRLRAWVDLHEKHANHLGFWGEGSAMQYRFFQNSYHQYEILRYLRKPIPQLEQAAAAVEGLADREGHFAPYPGGGGCYDYDAVSILTHPDLIRSVERDVLLARTFRSIINEQQPDGGFAESIYVTPWRPAFLLRQIRHALSSDIRAGRRERLIWGLWLLHPARWRIKNHWTAHARNWTESNLWDSWFRMLTLAVLQQHLHPDLELGWGFIDYPGIGWHEGAPC